MEGFDYSQGHLPFGRERAHETAGAFTLPPFLVPVQRQVAIWMPRDRIAPIG